MVLRPLKYGVTIISPQIDKILIYLYTVKIILDSDGTLLFQIGNMILKVLFISKGCILAKGTMFLRHFLVLKGHYTE